MHYGMDTYTLKEPKMIVIHCTEAGSLAASLACFKPAKIPDERAYLQSFGDLNVGVHYMVSKKGEIYRLMPDDIIGRHTIGFNYTALGIENVGKNNADLTKAQVHSNAQLVAWLVSQHPSIEYLIGHYEYTNKTLPHFALYIEKVTNYNFTSKVDPGVKFMKELREILKNKYNIILKD
jgi:N-acetyl-anhydromuramyl-L-alanine amidase AmpD